MFSKIIQTVKDTLFPVFCFGCECEGTVLCNNCLDAFDTNGILLCPVCHEMQPYGMCCVDCQQYSHLDAHIAGTQYMHGNTISKLIEALKYEYNQEAVDPLFAMIEPIMSTQKETILAADYIVPVPLHPKRFAARGFNQAERIASKISSVYGVPVEHFIQRKKYTQQQATLEKEERLINVASAFTLTAKADVQGYNFLLVDDVFTTGSTLQAAARVLKESGAASITGITIARG